MFKRHKPEYPPLKGTDKHEELSAFINNVHIILHTVNENEYQAAVTFLEPPSKHFKRSVVFPSAGSVVGRFAGHKVALIQTDAGMNSRNYIEDAIEIFKNTKYIYGVGVAYAFDRVKYKLGDVLVSNKICDLRSSKINKKGRFINRGRLIDVPSNRNEELDFKVSQDRCAKVHAGTIASFDMLMDNIEMRDKLRNAVPDVIGGEMEGGILMELRDENKMKQAMVVKAVVDYGDGTKGKKWQFTAAMAAFTYTKKLVKSITPPSKSTVSYLPIAVVQF